jgi:predicted O-linked N-acetylglucosamine transferase (SPINDLY family)
MLKWLSRTLGGAGAPGVDKAAAPKRAPPPGAADLPRLEQAARLAPDDAELQIELGRAQAAANKHAAAVLTLERALKLAPDNAQARLQLALLALLGGQPDKALAHLQVAVWNEPGLAEAQFHLGNLVRGSGQLQEAEQYYRLALQADPMYAAAHANLGGLLKDLGRPDEAARHLEQALQLQPDLGPAVFNLALLRVQQLRWDEAVVLLRQSLQLEAAQPEACYWLGNACMALGDAQAAREAYQAAIRLDGKFAQARWGLAMAQLPAVPLSEAEQAEAPGNFARELKKIVSWLQAQRPAEAYRAVGAQQPYYLAYIAQNHRAVLADYGRLCTQLMAGWAGSVGVPRPVAARGAKCRVGIVSAHIHSHSVWHAMLRGWVEHLDPAKFELQLFHTGERRDPETEWAARRVKQLHHKLGDWTSWAKAVSDGRFDVLVYPEIGMDATAVRLSALRLAPMQLAAWGHPISSGLPSMDGFISAAAFEPEGASAHYTETLHALPRLGCCYQPYGSRPTKVKLADFGIAAGDRVLLCAGTPFKYAPHDDALLVEIARRCRPCKLVFFRAKPEELAARLEGRLQAAFEAGGLVFDDCVRFIPWLAQGEFFGLLDQADVYLDSIGFSGFNTAMQAIERGTPLVAWEGEFMRGRLASGILRQAGLDEWVAGSAEAYLEKVERLCAERGLREQVRKAIVERRDALFDDRASVAAFGDLLLRLA